MMGSSAELTLGRPCHGVSHGEFGGSHVERMLKLEYYLKALEDERKKIDAFKRELPFCMQLLNDEIEASKEQLADYQEPAAKPQSTLTSICEEDQSIKSGNLRPVLEEFIPIKKPAEDVKEDNNVTTASNYLKGAKPNGVIQTRFWSPAEAFTHGQEMVSSMSDHKPYKKRDNMRMGGEGDIEVAKPILNTQMRGGAFLPFSGSKKQLSTEHLVEALHREASPPTPCADMARNSTVNGGRHHEDVKETHNLAVGATISYGNGTVPQAAQRKPRRCWSPELHRRFVNALQQLGGSEVATPKQIRELMKIDGLTNDEVKSHLQKYRLHTRRPNPTFHTAPVHSPQVVVLGGIWVPPEYAAQAAAASVSQAVPQEADQAVAERQAAHLQVTPNYSEERYIQLNSAVTTPLQLHPALYAFNSDSARAPAGATQSRESSQGPLHQMSAAQSSGGGREEAESFGEDEGSSWKNEDRAMHVDENEKGDSYNRRASMHVHKWMYNNACSPAHEISGEDDSEAEDGRVYETPV